MRRLYCNGDFWLEGGDIEHGVTTNRRTEE
jgi:hypothetical protein